MRTAIKYGTAFTLAALILSAGANAQEQDSEPAGEPSAAAQQPAEADQGSTEAERPQSAADVILQDIVVTGRKRHIGERAQDVPIAVTALTGEQFEAVFADDLEDIGELAPNVQFEGSTIIGLQNFTIRGMGITGSTPSDAPAVGIFQNGVFWGSNYGSLLDTFDIESVEILRGPQGTLFGRNVTGGAVLVRTRRPSNEFGAQAEVTVGNYGRKDVAVSVEGPIAGDVLTARLTGLYRSYDGYFHNLVTDKDYGKSDARILRGTLVFKPTDRLTLTAIGEHYRETGHSTPVVGIEVPGNNPYKAGFRQPDDYFDIYLDRPGKSNIKVNSATLEALWDIGPGTFTSITGYRKVFNFNWTDFDGTDYSGFNQSVRYESKQFTQEARYAAKLADWVSFTAGLYYFTLDHQFREGRNLLDNATIFASGNHLEQESAAGFGEIDFKPVKNLTVTLGGRYTWESITAQSRPFGGCPLPPGTDIDRYLDLTVPCDLGPSDTEKFTDFSPKIGITYRPAENILTYGSWTRGFRSGGFSLRGSALTPPFAAEQVDAFELGIKSDLFDRVLRFNLSLYRNNYSDLQRTIVFADPNLGTFQKTGNAADARIQGIELELGLRATRNLVFTGTYGLTDAKFNSFEGLDVTGDGVPDPELASQLDFVRVPKHTANLAATYSLPLADRNRLDFRASVNYVSGQYLDDLNRLREPSYTLLDASVTFATGDDRWRVSLFGKNLTNKEYAFYSASLGAIGLIELAGAPRTFGVRVNFDY